MGNGASSVEARPEPGTADLQGGWTPAFVAFLALLAGLLVTTALVVTSLALYHQNERRLLKLRARELGLVLSSALPTIQIPLASAAELADATRGDPRRFSAFLAPEVGLGRQFGSASLWPLTGGRSAPLAQLGTSPRLTARQKASLFAPSTRTRVLHVIGLLRTAHPGVGYAFATRIGGEGFAIYAESPLQANHRSKLENNSAFSDLDYAVYLGRARRSEDLLVTSLTHLPITSRQASDTVPFGDSALTLVVTPRGSLGGTFFERLPWIVAGFGVLAALAAALMTDRLARRRQRAQRLAGDLDRAAAEIERMYTEQRSIALTLQGALLPDALPDVDGLHVSARYIPATSGVEVGGDWYDVVPAGEDRVLLVIGDVSGHGLRAATTMASLRHATLAYAALDARPAHVLARLSNFVNSEPHDYFATVLCVMIDVSQHRLTAASAGHLPPLLLEGTANGFIELDVGLPIGIAGDPRHPEVNVSVAANATLVAFTDGLVERRGELIDAGLQRLREVAVTNPVPLATLVEQLPRKLAFGDHQDDTAIVGIQWQN